MRKNHLAVLFCALIIGLSAFAQENLSTDEIFAKHLESLGKPEARAKMNAIASAGSSTMMAISSGAVSTGGNMRLISQGKQFIYEAHYKSTFYYDGETLGYDGKKVNVGAFGVDTHSPLVDFFRIYPQLLEDGYFGGPLNHGWALTRLADEKPKMRNDGLKKYNGMQAIQIWCNPKKAPSEMYIKLFFDPGTFRLLGIQYYRNEHPYLEERFSNYGEVEGLTLPTHWEVYITEERGLSFKWDNVLSVLKPMPQLPKQ